MPYKQLPWDQCSWHAKRLPYEEWFADADRRAAAGEKQVKCKDCGRYFWPHELGEKPKETTDGGEQEGATKV